MTDVIDLSSRQPRQTEVIHPILYARDLTLDEFIGGDLGRYLFSVTVLLRTLAVKIYDVTHFTPLATSGQRISLASFVREDEATFGEMERLIFNIVNGVVVTSNSATQTNCSDIYVNYQLTQQAIADLITRYMQGRNGKEFVLISGGVKDSVFLDVPHSAYEATNLPKEKLSFGRKGRSGRIVFQ